MLKKRRTGTGDGKLVWHDCARCYDPVKAPENVVRVVCGSCVVRAAGAPNRK